MATYAESRANVESYASQAEDRYNAEIEQALSELADAYGEAERIKSEQLGSSLYDPAKRVQLIRQPWEDELSNLFTKLQDVSQRGGFVNAPNINKIMETSFRSLLPAASEQVQQAEAGRMVIQNQIADLKTSLASSRAGLYTKKADYLSNLKQWTAEQLKSIDIAEQTEKGLNERQSKQLAADKERLQLTLASNLMPGSAQSVYRNAGLDVNLQRLYGTSAAMGGGSQMALNAGSSYLSQIQQLQDISRQIGPSSGQAWGTSAAQYYANANQRAMVNQAIRRLSSQYNRLY